ncbi:monovalent cation/H(+) antiporter subunit G [Arthrobacter sulfonylureivorans]|uniref:monovalent cation/H(+) antiporter subunit G n=1 Tax=Arthrobacter sulfonylureivorans TaxID=2486855 RepID=UPI0039E21FB8
MNTDLILDIATAACLIVGSLMSLAAGIGLLRFPDLLSRMHAATKPQVFGLLLLLTGLALQLRSWVVVPVLVIAWLFQLLTVPVSAHMVGRAGYRTKHLRREILSVDDLDAVVEAAAREEPDAQPGAGIAGDQADLDPIASDPADPSVEDGTASDPADAEGGTAARGADPVVGDRQSAATAAGPVRNDQDSTGTTKD